MSASDSYVRNPTGIKGGKFGANNQDQEDFDQEKLIEQWLSGAGEIEYKYISRKGTARNTLDNRSIRLDQKIQDDSAGTFADLIAGSDGRDLECGPLPDEVEPKTATEKLDESLELFFDAIGVSEGTKKWGMKSVKSAESLRKLQSLMKEEKQLQISPISLESLKPLPNFKE